MLAVNHLIGFGAGGGRGALTGYTADLTSGETASASSSAGANTAEKAIDDNASTTWRASGTSGEWWQVTFSAGKEIRKVTLRNTAAGDGFNALPSAADVQYYNGSTYVTAVSISPAGVDTIQEFLVPEGLISTIWRIQQTASALGGGGVNPALDEVQMMEGVYA